MYNQVVSDPALIVCDEPTASLDSEAGRAGDGQEVGKLQRLSRTLHLGPELGVALDAGKEGIQLLEAHPGKSNVPPV